MKITLEVSTDHECTSSPYWMILDPKQMMSPDYHTLASMITGPFFSRIEAENKLKRTRYNYSKRAVVYCCSGCHSGQYDKVYRDTEKEQK